LLLAERAVDMEPFMELSRFGHGSIAWSAKDRQQTKAAKRELALRWQAVDWLRSQRRAIVARPTKSPQGGA
jgi:hypothetical protein